MSRKALKGYIAALSSAFVLLAFPTAGRCSWISDKLHDITAPVGHAATGAVKAVGNGLGAAGGAITGGLTTVVDPVIGGIGRAGGTVADEVGNQLRKVIADANTFVHDPNIPNAKALFLNGSIQYFQIVEGIKALKANGVIKTPADCQTGAEVAATGALGYTGDPAIATLTQEIGDAACNDAIPQPQQVVAGNPWTPPAPPGMPNPSQLPVASGFGADSDEFSRRFQPKPATCSERSQPGIPVIPAGWRCGSRAG